MFLNKFKSIIAPAGKIHPKYYQYIGWSFASNVLSSTESAMSTHDMLQAVGNSESSVIQTSNYIGKDIIGQIGGLMFMAKIGREADNKPRRFLLYANMFQQTAFMTVMLTPHCPDYFLPIAGLANVMFNISFTSFGAINAKCIGELSNKATNTGEIYAKISVLNTFGSSIGLLIGLGINAMTPDGVTRLGIIPVLAAGRVYCFDRAVSSLIV